MAPALEDLFSLNGIPTEIKTDNGSPFQSENLKEFARHGFKSRRIIPLHPLANEGSENFMKNLGKIIRNCSINRLNFKSELNNFLISNRDTPHEST